MPALIAVTSDLGRVTTSKVTVQHGNLRDCGDVRPRTSYNDAPYLLKCSVYCGDVRSRTSYNFV